MLKILCWSVPLSIAIGAMAYSTALYNMEAERQNAFMMKVCMDAGGEWSHYWNWHPYCKRGGR